MHWYIERETNFNTLQDKKFFSKKYSPKRLETVIFMRLTRDLDNPNYIRRWKYKKFCRLAPATFQNQQRIGSLEKDLHNPISILCFTILI